MGFTRIWMRFSQHTQGKGREYNPGQTASPSQDTHHPPTQNLQAIWTGGQKPENPQKTHADPGKTCRLHTERLSVWPGVKPWTLLLLCASAKHFIATSSCEPGLGCRTCCYSNGIQHNTNTKRQKKTEMPWELGPHPYVADRDNVFYTAKQHPVCDKLEKNKAPSISNWIKKQELEQRNHPLVKQTEYTTAGSAWCCLVAFH